MPTFSNRPIGRPQGRVGTLIARMTPQVRRHPVMMFGVPFIITIVASSYGLSYMTQTRYDYNSSKVQSVSKEEELGMRKDRRKIDIREEYFRLQAKDSELDDWEPKRIPRPQGLEEPLPPRSRTLQAEGPPLKEQGSGSDSIPSRSAGRRRDVILGPDGKPCRACNSKLAFSAAMRSTKGSDEKSEKGGRPGLSGPSPAIGSVSSTKASDGGRIECPPDGDTLGQNTWTFLHSAAAYYPNEPDDKQQSAMLSLIHSLPHLYPCHSCAESLGEELKREGREKKSWESGAPLQQAVSSGPGLRKWLCGLHNEVNARLGKPVWSCKEDVLRQRWLDGPDDGSCD